MLKSVLIVSQSHVGILTALALLASAQEVSAQQFEVSGLVGYQWGGSLDQGSFVSDTETTNFDMKLQGAPNFGLSVDVRLNEKMLLSFPLDLQQTQFNVTEEGQEERTLFDVSMHYFHVGLIFESTAGYLKPYLRVSLGITLIDAKNGFNDNTRGSASFALGVKKFVTKTVGVHIQGRYLGTYLSGSGQVFCDNFDNCVTLGDVSFINQFNITGGVVVAFEL